MSTGNPRQRQIELRQKMTNGDEPLTTVTRSIKVTDTQFLHNIPKNAREILDIEADDELEIDIYVDRYVVRRVPGGERNE